MIKYQGKRKLYEFLKTHGFAVPNIKEMQYDFYRGSEWIKCDEINLFAHSPKYMTVSTFICDEENGKMIEVGRFGYMNEICVYKRQKTASAIS